MPKTKYPSLETLTSAGTEGPKAMGQVIKAVKDRAGDAADGGRIAGLVKASLTL